MRTQDTQTFTNLSATPALFPLKGGKYGVSVGPATFNAGNVHFQKVAADHSTLVDVSAATNFTAAGYAVVDLPPGQYSLTITTATAVYAAISRVPGE